MAVKIHEQFKLNGHGYSNEELKEVAYSLIKEGEDFEKEIGDFLLDWLSPDPELTIRTSGSTGTPMGIALKKRHMVNSAKVTGEYFGLEAGDRVLLCLSTGYIAGKMMVVRAMILGLELDFVAPTSRPLDGVNKFYKFGAMVPLQLESSINKLNQFQTVIVGGAPVSSQLMKLIADSKTKIFETYGMTETVTHVAVRPLSQYDAGSDHKAFKILPDIAISQDDRKCLVINAPNISDNPVITNDIVELISEKEFLWLGRFDNVINSGGIKLIPEQIEQKLTSFIPSRFFVSALPDSQLGKKLILVVEGEKIDGLQEIISKADLEKFELPKEIFYVSAFKNTANGKIIRDKSLSLIKS
ncbi:AMP-binding protein [uncultured Eudoraea sp.]|uniref:AMP-binding protein n=1 Tax=uncultured Eudoraea sp. TaxID=1035614 RepID=UPI002632A952|nr:AMP-binding protein [uncultured Eudoraea sp.]